MPEARAGQGDAAAGPGPGLAPRPRSLSQSKTHPWLVKADEPEPEPAVRAGDGEDGDDDEPAFEIPLVRSRVATMSQIGRPYPARPDECAVEDEADVVGAPQTKVAALCRYDDHVHGHQHETPEPLEAIELIPYRHQVGGHTTLWRFSRRAVCKQLNNRENEFYETIERYHRDLLPFLPR